MCEQSGVNEVPKIVSQESVEAVKEFSFRSEFSRGCVNRSVSLRCPRSQAKKVSRLSTLSLRSAFPKGCVNRPGLLKCSRSQARRVSRRSKIVTQERI